MQSIWLNLLWKEWREHQWKLVALFAIAFALPLVCLATYTRDVPMSGMVSLMGVLAIAPIYVAAGIGAAERRRGTLPFLQAQPVATWQWAVAKLAVGLVVVWLPAFTLLLFMYWLEWASPTLGVDLQMSQVQQGPFDNWHQIQLTWILVVAPSIYLWSLAAGVNRSDEIRAAALAVVVMVGYCCVLASTFGIAEDFGVDSANWLLLTMATAPGGLLLVTMAIETNPEADLWPMWVLLMPALLVHSMLALWFVVRFGRVADYADRSPPAASMDPAKPLAVRRPFGTRGVAIVWAQLRELGFVAALCPIVTLALAAVFATFGPYNTIDFADRMRQTLPTTLVLMGVLFTTVLGAGVFLRDVEPGLGAFWRSRPINPNRWFWTKYLVGLGLWAAALGIPAAVLIALDFLHATGLQYEWFALAIPAAVGLAIFTTSMAAMCLVRQPVYACLLGLGAVSITLGPVGLRLRFDNEITASVIFTALMVAITLISTLLAWLAIRYDWGWQPAD